MTILTPEHVASEAENLLNSVIGSIKDLRQELEDLKERVRAGEGLEKTQDSRTVASATTLLKTCQEVENRLVECRSKSAGIARGGYALDLERARTEIGCKLDRLRCTARPG
jgi:antitoxin (DNA-binding transcriptional repressor) of toxin-antitoxin stability system